MDTNNTLITGIAPEHIPALVAALLLPFALRACLAWLRWRAATEDRWAQDLLRRYDGAPLIARVTAYLLLTTAAVHLALPLGHNDAPLVTLLFLASSFAFTALALAGLTQFGQARWRTRTILILLGSIVSYMVLAGSGWQEQADQVGIATKLVEITALGLVLVPALQPARGIRRKLARPAASSAFVVLTVVAGAVVWVGTFVSHTQADAVSTDPHEHAPGTLAHGHEVSGHSHAFAARAQAGIIMRPGNNAPPTLNQAAAAARLADETRAGLAKYQDHRAAIADGYLPDGPKLGVELHFSNEAYKKDGRILDPARPELLVYASDGERYLLLGAAYTMPRAGAAGPRVGGSITQWHSHNICFTLMPPGFGIVSPYGGCPLGAVAATGPEMMHVWTVDYPGGPFADTLDDKWVKRMLAASRDPAQAP